MTNKKISYKCEACGGLVEVVGGEMEMPKCCGRTMKTIAEEELDFCEKAVGAEFARPGDEDAPCDDGRSGKIGKTD